jgi:hypothetical protein
MRKYLSGVLVIFVVTAVLLTISLNRLFSASAVDSLGNAMEVTGAALSQFSINGWTKLPSSHYDDKELAEIVEKSLLTLGLKAGQYDLKYSKSERHRLVRAEATEDHKQIVVTAQVIYPTWSEKAAEVYLVINIEAAAEHAPISAWHKKVVTAIDGVGGTPHISTCLIGWLDGKLEKNEWIKRLELAGQILVMTNINILDQPGFASIVGYSPIIPEWVDVGDKRINVNLAMRYNSVEDRTYVLIGSPVITGEY